MLKDKDDFESFKSDLKDSLICTEYEEVVVDMQDECFAEVFDWWYEEWKKC